MTTEHYILTAEQMAELREAVHSVRTYDPKTSFTQDAHRMLSILNSAQRVTQEPAAWQPIGTAPTDTRVLIFDPHAGTMAVANRRFGGWWATHLNTPKHAWNPTHWMPLPKEPTP